MTMPVENDGKWNIYREIVQQSPELEQDLITLHRLVAKASDHYDRIYERYIDSWELPGGQLLHSQLSFALGDPEILLGVLPGEAEKPE
jgi:hypothetical protein